MDSPQNFKNQLISISEKKIEHESQKIINSFPDCANKSIHDNLSPECVAMLTAINRYAEANIPVDYWHSSMANFVGDKSLLRSYESIIADLNKSYDGLKICYAGKHGVGKTMTCACILKAAVESGYSGLYIMLTEIVNLLAARNTEDKEKISSLLKKVDFLIIDEFDPRFMGSENASDLYGRILEPTLRIRIQNRMPLIMCTNSPDVVKSFTGPIRDSISSLMSMVNVIPVLGQDFRPNLKAAK